MLLKTIAARCCSRQSRRFQRPRPEQLIGSSATLRFLFHRGLPFMNMQLVTHTFACPYTILLSAADRKANENNGFPRNLWGGLQRVPGGFRTIFERVPGGFRRVPEGSMAFSPQCRPRFDPPGRAPHLAIWCTFSNIFCTFCVRYA